MGPGGARVSGRGAPFLARLASWLPAPIKGRLAVLRPVYLGVIRARTPIARVEAAGAAFYWAVDDLTTQEYLLGTYEHEMQEAVRSFVLPGCVVYDVGAHAGFHSLLCAALTGPTGLVVALEPNPKALATLRRQITANPHAPLRVLPYAVTDHSNSIRLDTSQGTAMSRISAAGDVPAPATTIDSVVELLKMPPPDLIKIDAEGSEEAVLTGALATLSRHHPTILCDYNDDLTLPTVERLLSPLGYRIDPSGPIIARHAPPQPGGQSSRPL